MSSAAGDPLGFEGSVSRRPFARISRSPFCPYRWLHNSNQYDAIYRSGQEVRLIVKILKDCWKFLGVSECQYGAHIFDGVNATIYVNNWLAAFGGLDREFFRKNSDGFVGHCLLVFLNIKRFDFVVTPYMREDDGVVWCDPVRFIYAGPNREEASKYELEGSLHGFSSSVSILVEARDFELRILEGDEPAHQS
ncbi:hypothetical protein ACR42A_01570 [Burkholderia gladioli]|uniref:hypothetical protein n=1 Tax=Burkholderia gladioli TaxID=28095 RepID=UPI0021B1B128|nr:hypothetical protein [Burkholderia gladioli]